MTGMARAALENALAPEALDKLFDEKATLGYTRELLCFSTRRPVRCKRGALTCSRSFEQRFEQRDTEQA
jgi:hypothetical protein